MTDGSHLMLCFLSFFGIMHLRAISLLLAFLFNVYKCFTALQWNADAF